ncbi:MAG: efflux RND transporter periplasmic adaptor subunit [Pseudomonadota bacterium]
MVIATGLVLAACQPDQTDEAASGEPVRGLVTTEVKATGKSTIRTFPGVLEPGEVNVLAFEVGGKLGKLDLTVGQTVSEGQLLAELEPEKFAVTVENRKALVEEAEATLQQAEEDLARSETLLARGVITKVRRDSDRTAAKTARAQLTQASKELESAEEDLADSKLYAPFDGVINAIDVESFETVGSGQSIVSVYTDTSYEVSFSVNFDVVAQLSLGTDAFVRLSDDPATALAAEVTELGERAETVSAFPVIVSLIETSPILKPGMAAEVSFEFELPVARGFLIPISAAIPLGQIPDAQPNEPQPLPIYVYDPETSTVKQRQVTFAGLRDNQVLVIDGLSEGEHVATKGVSFLREGMKVKLLEPEG